MPHTAGYRKSVSTPTIRAVWRAVTAQPRASCRELAAHLGRGYSTVAAALWHLEQAGYVTSAAGHARTRCIVVPFGEVRR